jgi:methyltransferase-like protein/trans-aconitate methyltransferase
VADNPYDRNPYDRNPYDQVAYRTFPRRQTHPDRLAAIARLFGITPAPVTACRVLEIGCGNGANLIPLAYHLPHSRFTGIDLAAGPVTAACAMAAELALPNIALRVADLRDLGAEAGEFDYIFAHGLYSWIPAAVRDRLLAVCRERLAPEGVAFVSYNTYPGRYPRQMIREILLYHTRALEDPAQRIAEARRLLGQLDHPEAQSLMEQGDDSLFHDDLAPINHPVWFREFAAHAQRHKLQYLGEADSHHTFDPAMAQAGRDAQDVIETEQYVDFVKLRPFRQSLLCREEIPLHRAIGAARMDEFLFSENRRARRIRDSKNTRIFDDRAVEAVAQALHDTAPLPAPFEELIPYAGSRELLREILCALLTAGCVNLHVHDFPCQETVTARPRASRLARYQAAGGGNLTSACHIPVELDAIARHLVRLLDGTRTHEEIACELASVAGAPSLEDVRRHLPGSLGWLARMALLEG